MFVHFQIYGKSRKNSEKIRESSKTVNNRKQSYADQHRSNEEFELETNYEDFDPSS